MSPELPGRRSFGTFHVPKWEKNWLVAHLHLVVIQFLIIHQWTRLLSGVNL